jgi:hypothetical protein
LLINFDPGASFNLGAYTAFDNKTTAPITENPVLTSSAAAPIDNTDLFTSSVDKSNTVNNSNTAYSLYNGVSLKSGSATSVWTNHGAELRFDAKGSIISDSSDESLNVYEKNNKEGVEITKLVIEHDKEIKKANAEKWGKLFEMLSKIAQLVPQALSGGGTA